MSNGIYEVELSVANVLGNKAVNELTEFETVINPLLVFNRCFTPENILRIPAQKNNQGQSYYNITTLGNCNMYQTNVEADPSLKLKLENKKEIIIAEGQSPRFLDNKIVYWNHCGCRSKDKIYRAKFTYIGETNQLPNYSKS